jgi:hypothetical protein|tara:strand:+ start:641 stop:904 length:264 start_codon:yes stop_codon:yes gene_type:complete
MDLRYALRINYALRKKEDRAYPYDMLEEALEDVMYFSNSAGKDICILDMDVLHVVRAFIKKKNAPSKSKVALEKVKGLLNELDLSTI